MTQPTQDLIERLRNGTAHLSLRQIEELWADAAGALEAAIKTQQLGQTKPAQDDNLYRLSLLVESDVLPDGLEVRRVVKAALQEFAALRRASCITELQDEKNELAAYLDKTIAVAADAVTRASAAEGEVLRLRAEAARAWQNLDEYIARKEPVDVTIALAYEVLRAALDQQGDRG